MDLMRTNFPLRLAEVLELSAIPVRYSKAFLELYLPTNFGRREPSFVIDCKVANPEAANSSWLSGNPNPICVAVVAAAKKQTAVVIFRPPDSTLWC